MEFLIGYAIFWFIDRSVRKFGRDIRDEYRKITATFTGRHVKKHPEGTTPTFAWRAGVKTAAVFGAATVGGARGGKNFATGFRDRWQESRQMAKANREQHRRDRVQPLDDTMPGAPRRLSEPVAPPAPGAEPCAQPGCRTTPVLPSTGRCFDHSSDEARIAWLNDHEPGAPKANLVKKVQKVQQPPFDLAEFSEDARTEIQDGCCAWRTNWGDSDQRFCGKERTLDGPYCPEHTAKLDQIENSNPFNPPTSTGGTVTEGVNYGQMVANCEKHLEEATGEIESARVREREANLAFEDAQAGVKLAEDEATRIEADAAALATLHAPADMMAKVADVQEATSDQKTAAEEALAVAEQQKKTADRRMAAAERKHAAVQALLDEIQRYQTAVDVIDGLGGPQGVPDVEWLTHG